MPIDVHHINFLVRDLDVAEARYRDRLNLPAAQRDALPGRGVATARFRLNNCWLVLVQPLSEEGEPARLLRENGEGFMLLSLGVDDLDAERERLGDDLGPERRGLDGWRVADLCDLQGARLQLTQRADASTAVNVNITRDTKDES